MGSSLHYCFVYTPDLKRGIKYWFYGNVYAISDLEIDRWLDLPLKLQIQKSIGIQSKSSNLDFQFIIIKRKNVHRSLYIKSLCFCFWTAQNSPYLKHLRLLESVLRLHQQLGNKKASTNKTFGSWWSHSSSVSTDLHGFSDPNLHPPTNATVSRSIGWLHYNDKHPMRAHIITTSGELHNEMPVN
jgi:hypothetical protein